MKAVVLLSGGVDSSTCLGIAVNAHNKENVKALFVSYGQKHCKEFISAENVAKFYGVELYRMDLSKIFQYSNCPLLAHSTEEIRHESYAEQIKKDGEGTVDTYVPFRNGLLLSSASSLAMSLFPENEVVLYYGAHADDAAGSAYPDCTPGFVREMHMAVMEGSGGLLGICAPFIGNNKKQIIEQGKKLGVPYHLTWSCYEGGRKACGTCGTCIDRKQAFKENGMEDPIEYEENN